MRMLHPCPKPAPKAKKARKPLRRGKPMRRKRARRINRETELEKRFKAWIHRQSCSGPVGHGCSGDLQQAHFRDHTGLGLKSDNFSTLRMCQYAHDSYDGRLGRNQGCFAGWTTEQKKAWFMAHVIEHCARFQLETGEAILPAVDA